MNAKSILNSILRAVDLAEMVKLEQQTLDNGTVIEADMFEAGSPVFVVTDGNQVPLPAGQYTLADGRVLVVANGQDGVIASIDAPAQMQEQKVDASSEPEYLTKGEFIEAMAGLKEILMSVQKPAEEKKVELSVDTEAAAKAINHNPEKEAKTEMFQISQNRAMTTADLVMKQFSNLNLQ